MLWNFVTDIFKTFCFLLPSFQLFDFMVVIVVITRLGLPLNMPLL